MITFVIAQFCVNVLLAVTIIHTNNALQKLAVSVKELRKNNSSKRNQGRNDDSGYGNTVG